jgi:hypothetical protein
VSIVRRNIFGDPALAGSSGNGSDSPPQSDPNTGDTNDTYQAPQPSSRMDATNAMGDPTAHGDISSYRQTYDRLTGAIPDDASAYGRDLGDSDQFTAQTDTGSGPDSGDADESSDTGSTGAGKAIAGSDPLVTRSAGADSGDAFGKAI